jgi:large subunit ribosomal protein L24
MRDLKYKEADRPRRKYSKRHAGNAERVRTKITKGDTVRIMRGDDKGKTGKVLRVFLKTGRVTVEGINIVKKHRRARTAQEQSGIIEMPAAMHLSNVMLVDSAGNPTRVKMRVDEDGTKERMSVKGGDVISRNR